jgi:integrase
MTNTKKIDDFINFKTNENLSDNEITENSALHYRRVLNALNKSLKNKSFNKATEQDILNYLSKYKPSVKNVRIPMLKSFYRWLYNLEEDDKLPECIRRIKKSKKASKKDDIEYRERIITEFEYKRVIENTPKLVQKAIIETLYNFGIRLSELHSMKSQDVKYKDGITKITVRISKTKTRDVVFNGRSKLLLKYHETYFPYKNQNNKPLWIFGIQNKPYKKSGIERFISRISLRAINRHITPHDFRHTAITKARANNVPSTFIEANFGLTKNSSMMKIYDHNKTKDYEKWLREKQQKTKPEYEIMEKSLEESTQQNEILIHTIQNQIKQFQIGFEAYNEFIEEYLLKPLGNGIDLRKIDHIKHLFKTCENMVDEPEIKEQIRQRRTRYNLKKDYPRTKT